MGFTYDDHIVVTGRAQSQLYERRYGCESKGLRHGQLRRQSLKYKSRQAW